ncbi:MAG: HD domain-containing protein [Rhodothermales bacterium]|nr:HD domain-containing protein [Rhodothermales bacterium]
MEPIFSPLIEQAVELAAQWHEGTYRKGTWRAPAFEVPEEAALGRVPMMVHVTAVALTVQRAGFGEAAVAAAFLHDVLEDANRYGDVMGRSVLADRVGEEVAAIVATVTEQKRDAAGTPRGWRARKEGYLAQLRAGTLEAAAVSLADKLHNLWSMNESVSRGIDVFTSAPAAGRSAPARPSNAGSTTPSWRRRPPTTTPAWPRSGTGSPARSSGSRPWSDDPSRAGVPQRARCNSAGAAT